MRVLNLSLIIISSISVFANDWKTDLNNIRARYNSYTSYEAVMDYNVHIDGVLFQTAPAVMKFHNGSYHLKTDDLEVFSNSDFNLTVKPSNKLFVVGPSITKNGILSDLDSLEIFISSVESRKQKNGYVVHRLYYKQGKTAWVELEFNPETFELIVMRKANRYSEEFANGEIGLASLEVVFKSVTKDVKFTQNEFSGTKYIRYSNGVLKPSPSFSSYNLINLLTTNQ